MLQSFRDAITGWFAYVIVAIIVIPFALFGINQYFEGGGDAFAARVNGVDIPVRAFELQYSRERQSLQERFGGQLPPWLADSMLRAQVLEQMVNTELLRQLAEEERLFVPDALLLSQIRSIEVFHDENGFSPEIYEAQLASVGLSRAQFEFDARRDLSIQQLRGGVADSDFLTDSELAEYARLSKQQRQVLRLRADHRDYLDEVSVDDEEITRYFEAHAAEFTDPERVRVEFIKLDTNILSESISASDELLKQLYEEQAERFVSEEQRRARHILLQVPPDATTEAEAEIKAEIETLRERLLAGESFEELAKAHSDDPGSGRQGGDLGMVPRGIMVAPFEEALFAIEEGVVSEPVRTRFGFHIIRVDEIIPQTVRPFEEVRDELLGDHRNNQAESLFYDAAEQLANLAFEYPDSLIQASEALTLPIEQSDWFDSVSGEGLAATPEVRRAAFSDDVRAGNNSDLIEIGPNQAVVLRLLESQPERQKELDEVKSEIEAIVKQQKATESAQQQGQQALERVRAGEAPEAVGKALRIEFLASESWSRNQPGAERAIVEAAFSVNKPAEGGIRYRGIPLDSGDYVVIGVSEVSEGSLEALEESEQEQLKAQMQGREDGFELLLEALKETAEIERQEIES